MKKFAETFLKNIRMITDNDNRDNQLITIEFKDSSLIEFNIDSQRYKLFTAPMLKTNITTAGRF